MLELNQKDLEVYKKNLENRRKSFTIERKRGERHLVVAGKKIAKLKRKNSLSFLDKEEAKAMFSMLGAVKKSVNRYIVTHDFTIKLIKKKYNSVFSNRELFDELPVGSQWYYVDVKHCYWRVAYLQGYITEYYYEKVLENPDLKLYRNMALSCVIAGKEVEYFYPDKEPFIISEDMTLHNIIYQNIRHTVWNLFGTLAFEKIGEECCLGYFTDGIMVFPNDLSIVKTVLARQKLQHRIILCEKTAHREYVYLDEGTVRRY